MRRGYTVMEVAIIAAIIGILVAMAGAKFDEFSKTRQIDPHALPNPPIIRGQIIGYNVCFITYEREFLTRDPKGKYHILHFDQQWRLESDKEIKVDPGEER